MITTDDVRNSLYIEEGVDEELLQGYIDFATGYVAGAVGIDEARNDDRFKGAVMFLVEMLYMNRGNDLKEIPVQVRVMITQLKATYLKNGSLKD